MPIILMAALALAGPGLDSLFGQGGYPTASVKASRSAASLVRLLIDPDGRVVRCETMAAVGNADLATEACARARHRKVRAAVDANGSPAWSQVSTMAQFYSPGSAESDEVARSGPTPDAELTVRRLPGGAVRADVKVVLAVDEHGVVTDCVTDPRAAAEAGSAMLVNAVCASRAVLGLKPVSAPDGHPLRYVAPLTVRLSARG